MRVRPNFGIVGQAQATTNGTTGTVKTVADYITNTVSSGINIDAGASVTTVGDYKIVTFTGSGSFTAATTANVELMMIGGGGGGGTGQSPGGASSGGLIYYGTNAWPWRSGTSLQLTGGTTYTVTIGAGGNNTGFFNANGSANYGNLTTISYSYGGNTTITGGSINLVACGGSCWFDGSRGAPGAGSAGYRRSAAGSGDTGNSSTSASILARVRIPYPNQGYEGGEQAISDSRSLLRCGPGAGGTGAIGMRGASVEDYGGQGDNIAEYMGFGGNGFLTDITGTLTYFGGGGGGGVTNSYSSRANGGYGGGGSGALKPSSGAGIDATAGLPNTGGGGGGGGYWNANSPTYTMNSAAGGSGIVIIKYRFQ